MTIESYLENFEADNGYIAAVHYSDYRSTGKSRCYWFKHCSSSERIEDASANLFWPVPSPEVKDSSADWVDSNGDSCSIYRQSMCANHQILVAQSEIDEYKVNGMSATEICAECGGGVAVYQGLKLAPSTEHCTDAFTQPYAPLSNYTDLDFVSICRNLQWGFPGLVMDLDCADHNQLSEQVKKALLSKDVLWQFYSAANTFVINTMYFAEDWCANAEKSEFNPDDADLTLFVCNVDWPNPDHPGPPAPDHKKHTGHNDLQYYAKKFGGYFYYADSHFSLLL